MLPNGFNVYPEDIENALRIAGIRDAIAVETKPGRIEAVVLSGSASPGGATAAAALGGAAADPAEIRARLDAAVKAANATLGPNQRIAGWRLWPEDDFPRTHTLKIKRGPIQAWAAVEGGAPAGPLRRRPPTSAAARARPPSPRPGTASRWSRARPGWPASTGRASRPAASRRGSTVVPTPRITCTVPGGVWTRAGSGHEVALLLRGGLGRARRVAQLVDHDVAVGRVGRQDRLVHGPRRVREDRPLGRPVRDLRVLELQLVLGERRGDLGRASGRRPG